MFSIRRDENSWNGFPVSMSGSLSAVEKTSSIGRTHSAAQKPRNPYFAAGDQRTLDVARRGCARSRTITLVRHQSRPRSR